MVAPAVMVAMVLTGIVAGTTGIAAVGMRAGLQFRPRICFPQHRTETLRSIWDLYTVAVVASLRLADRGGGSG